MRVRVKENRVYSTFRRAGITFTREWRDVDPGKLTPQRLQFLLSEESKQFLEVEDAPASPARHQADFEAPFHTDDTSDGTTQAPLPPARPRTQVPPPKKAK